MINGHMDTAERENRYTLNGKRDCDTVKTRKKANEREIRFARKVLKGKTQLRPIWRYIAQIAKTMQKDVPHYY